MFNVRTGLDYFDHVRELYLITCIHFRSGLLSSYRCSAVIPFLFQLPISFVKINPHPVEFFKFPELLVQQIKLTQFTITSNEVCVRFWPSSQGCGQTKQIVCTGSCVNIGICGKSTSYYRNTRRTNTFPIDNFLEL